MFLTPQEDSLPATSPEPMVVERETRARVESQRKRKSIREFIYSLKSADQMFDKMPLRNQEAKMGSAEASHSGEKCDFLVRKKQTLKMGNGVKTGVINNISSTQIIDLDEDQEHADSPMRNNTEVKIGHNGHINTEIVDLNDVEVPTRNRDVVDLPKGDDGCHKGKVATRVLPRWLFNKDGFLIKNNDDPNKEMKRNGVEKMLEIVKSKSVASSLSGKTKEDEIMKYLLDGLDLVISIDNEKVDSSETGKEVDILGAAMRRGLVCTRPSWWPPEKKIPEPGVGDGSGRV